MDKRKIVTRRKTGFSRSYRNWKRPAAGDVQVRADQLRLLVIDVDGTMTDAGIYYDENGNELKKFCTRDAAGFFAARAAGIKTMILTGRESAAVVRRMKELGVEYVMQNVRDKRAFLEDFLAEQNLGRESVGYIGDDLNDLASMRLAGFAACPADACREVRKEAHYVSPVCGGEGAVRDVVEYLLRKCGKWERAVAGTYGVGI